MSQAAAPGLVEPCPLCEMKIAASWCSTVVELSGLVTIREVAEACGGAPGYSMAKGIEPGLEAAAHFTPEALTYSNGVQVVEETV